MNTCICTSPVTEPSVEIDPNLRGSDLLAAIVRFIRTNPDLWDQSQWSSLEESLYRPAIRPNCGTSFCVAGWAAQATGGWWASESTLIAEDEEPLVGPCVTHVEDRARRLLQLTEEQAEWLFHSTRQLCEIAEFAEAYAVDPDVDVSRLNLRHRN